MWVSVSNADGERYFCTECGHDRRVPLSISLSLTPFSLPLSCSFSSSVSLALRSNITHYGACRVVALDGCNREMKNRGEILAIQQARNLASILMWHNKDAENAMHHHFPTIDDAAWEGRQGTRESKEVAKGEAIDIYVCARTLVRVCVACNVMRTEERERERNDELLEEWSSEKWKKKRLRVATDARGAQ